MDRTETDIGNRPFPRPRAAVGHGRTPGSEPPKPFDPPSTLPITGTLHWVHWLVIALSLGLTFLAWFFAKSQLDDRVATRFDREAAQVIELVSERMQKYEDGLWGGVGAIHTHGHDITHEQWLRFSRTLSLDVKYPGINGIGVIHYLSRDDVPEYLERQRRTRPDFVIHPEHQQHEFLPITYIEPVDGNRQAVGLDMAHEANRYAASLNARDTGLAQITGPIVLVQDEERTPGFLFFAPFYRREGIDSLDERREHFAGMVYAPFVVKKLMEGVLARHNRYVGLSISDGAHVLYDEHHEDIPDFDPDPLFRKTVHLDLYGRAWTFDVWSAASFRAMAKSSQPATILIGGIVIDTLLLILFWLLARANHKAHRYAHLATEELRQQARLLEVRSAALERSNAELNRFATVASHDLQEPLRKVLVFGERLDREAIDQLDDRNRDYLRRILGSVDRMRQLVQDLLAVSRFSSVGLEVRPLDLGEVVNNVISDLELRIDELKAEVVVSDLPTIVADATQMRQLFQNLISNALKFHRTNEARRVEISSRVLPEQTSFAGAVHEITIQDNGIGFSKEYRERIFELFGRLHGRSEYEGSGVGLTVCRKIVDRHHGTLTAYSTPGEGATFVITLPTEQPVDPTLPAATPRAA